MVSSPFCFSDKSLLAGYVSHIWALPDTLQYWRKEGGCAVCQFAEFGCVLQTVGGQLAGSGKFFDELLFYIIDKSGFFKDYIQFKIQIKTAAVAVA